MKAIIIIGAGLAGYSVAKEVRKLDKLVPLVILTADDGDAYSKPMLSNAFAQGKSAAQLISQRAAQLATQLDARIVTNTRVQAIDTIIKTVTTDTEILEYDKLVIAVGAQPIRLNFDGDAADQVLSVNHVSDYAIFRARMELVAAMQVAQDAHVTPATQPVHIAILGAGLIGCEFANDLASAGHAVTLIDPNPLPLAALAAPALSEGLRDALLACGVALRLGTTAARIDHHEQALQLTLANGSVLQADVVLSAIGLRADLTLAHAAQLKTGRGIVVDAMGCSSAADVYALGDCAEYTLAEHGYTSTLPYIAPLLTAARAIARSLTGLPTVIDLKPAPVIVKTPCYPLALVPPPLHKAGSGQWLASTENTRTVCRYVDVEGVLLGFGVAPQETGVRQALLAGLGLVAG